MKKSIIPIMIPVIALSLFGLSETACSIVLFDMLFSGDISLIGFLTYEIRPFLFCLLVSAIFTALLYILQNELSVCWHIQSGKRCFRFHLQSFLVTAVLMVCCQLAIQSALTVKNYLRVDAEIDQIREQIEDDGIIVHAAGYYDGPGDLRYKYPNSCAALENCFSNGIHLIELDFLFTSDHHLICLHSWDDLRFSDGRHAAEPVTYEEFLSCKIYGTLPVMDIETVIRYLRSRSDFYIITDVKSHENQAACEMIANLCPDLRNRFIVQIYHSDEYDEIVSLGFHQIIYTFYAATEEEKSIPAIRKFIYSHPLVGLTFKKSYANQESFFPDLKSLHIPIYVHTVNNKKQILNFYKNGISAVYSNYVMTRREV